MTTAKPEPKLTAQDWRALVDAALATREVEIGCDECLEQVASYAETKLVGLSTPDALRLVEEHLELCEDCREEYEALVEGLRAAPELQAK